MRSWKNWNVNLFYPFGIFVFFAFLSCPMSRDGTKVVRNKGPGIWAKQGNKKIVVVPEFTIGQEQYPEGFGGWLQVKSDGQGNIYVLDFLKGCIVKFDSLGKLKRAIGKGIIQGPFDFHIGASGKIYVADMKGGKIEIFDSTGSLAFTFPYPVLPYWVREYPGKRVLIVGPRKGLVFHICDYSGNVLRRFGKEGRPIRSDVDPYMPICYVSPDGKVYSFNENQYEIAIYDSTGRERRKITREDVPPPCVHRTKEGIGYYKTWGSSGIDVADNGIIVNLFFYEEEGKYHAYMDFFGPDGKLLITHDIAGWGLAKWVDANRCKLFTVNGEEPIRITCYGFRVVDIE